VFNVSVLPNIRLQGKLQPTAFKTGSLRITLGE
jgi:hypothetical protein